MTNINPLQNKILYRLAGVGALLALATNLLDIAFSPVGTEVTVTGTQSATEWYYLFQGDGFRGLYMLGILNIVYMICMIPVYMGLFAVHHRRHFTLSVTATMLFLLALAIYVSNNAAIPMAVLSGKYTTAATEAQRALIAAAGEAVLARGEDFTPGAFPGMMLSSIAAITISAVMLRGKIFSKANAWVGVAGFSLLTLLTVTATFIPSLYVVSYYVFGMIGGLLALAWFLLTALRFLKLSRADFEVTSCEIYQA